MSDDKETTRDAMFILTNAVAFGSLPANADIHSTRSYITVTIDTDNYYRPDFNEIQAAADTFAGNFPGGETRRLQCIHRGKPSRKIPAKDRMEYRAKLANGTILLRYVAEHECIGFHGTASLDAKPSWVCRGCGRTLTVTECRKLGLLPALVKGRKP